MFINRYFFCSKDTLFLLFLLILLATYSPQSLIQAIKRFLKIKKLLTSYGNFLTATSEISLVNFVRPGELGLIF